LLRTGAADEQPLAALWNLKIVISSDYEKQINKFSEENKNLQVSFAENSFLGQALEKIQALNFQKTASVKYIKIPDNSVATAKTK